MEQNTWNHMEYMRFDDQLFLPPFFFIPKAGIPLFPLFLSLSKHDNNLNRGPEDKCQKVNF